MNAPTRPTSPIHSDSLVLAVDIGSSSVRAVLLEQGGAALHTAQSAYDRQTTPDGGVMVDPLELLNLVEQCVDEVLAAHAGGAGRGRPIGAVVLASMVANVCAAGADGTPLTEVYTWADKRGAELAPALRQALGDAAAYTHRTGCRVHTSYWPLRLLWLASQRSPHAAHAGQGAIDRAAHWLSVGELWYMHLFGGARRVGLSAASWSGLFNRHENAWDAATLDALNGLGVPIRAEMLSEPSDAPLQGLAGVTVLGVPPAKRWPALRDALFFPAVGDGVASNLGAGCTDARHIALAVGTSGALRVVVPGRPAQAPDGLFCYCVDAGRSLVGGALSNAGNLYAWLGEVLRAPDPSALAEAAAALPPDSHGLTILPFLAGERAPGWNDKAQAAFVGMTLDTRPEHIQRAALEAVAYRFYQIAARLEAVRAPDAVYVASGGPALSAPAWMQIIADVLNAPVYASAESEATVRGAMYLALGANPPPALGRAYLPDPARSAIYRAGAERQAALYARLLG